MLAYQHHAQPRVHHRMFGLSADGEPTESPPTESVAERKAAIRRRILIYGLAGSLASGIGTGGIAATTLALAGTPRVWQPALFLGLVSAVPLAVVTLFAAANVNDDTVMTATPTTTTITTPTTEPTADTPAGWGATPWGQSTLSLSLIPRRWLGQ